MKPAGSFSQLKSTARQNLAGNYMTFFLAIVTALGLSFAIDSILSWTAAPLLAGQGLFSMIAGLMVTFLVHSFVTVLQAGILYVSLNIARRSQATVGDVLLGFRYHPETAIAISLLTGLLRTVCTLPLYFAMDRIYALGLYDISGTGKTPSPLLAVSGFLAGLIAAAALDFLILYSYPGLQRAAMPSGKQTADERPQDPLSDAESVLPRLCRPVCPLTGTGLHLDNSLL